MSTNKTRFEGVIPALLNPVNDSGKTDHALLEKQVEYLVSGGIAGIFVNGSTAESPYMSTQDKVEVFNTVKRSVAGRAVLCAACIQPSTEQTLEELKVLEKLGPDYVVAVTPYYFKVQQKAIVEHYRAIAKASSVPVLAYDIPSCTHNKIEFSTMLELAAVDNIRGLKDSSGDFVTFSRAVLASKRPDFAWIDGEDYLDAAAFNVGAAGIVTGTGNVWIEPYVEMFKAAKRGDFKAVNEQQKRINALQEVYQVVGGRVIPGIKAAVSLLGRSTPWMRQRSMSLNQAEIEKVRGVLEGLGLLS